MRAITILLSLLVGGAVSAQQDTQAIIVDGQFVCGVDTIDISTDPTVAPVRSVQLYRSDAPGFVPVCSNMLGPLNELTFHADISFLIPYETNAAGVSVKPQMRASGFSELNCAGLASPRSANACIVTHGLPAPIMSGAGAPPVAVGPSSTVVPGTIPIGTMLVRVVVDPNGTALSAVVLNFSAEESGLQILDVASSDAQMSTSGPALSGTIAQGGFAGVFAQDRLNQFEAGTLTLEGVQLGAALTLQGNYTDGEFNDLPIESQTAARVQ